MDISGAWRAIKNLSKKEFEEKINSESLPKNRKDLLFKFIQGEIQVSYNCKLDVEEYALKYLMPYFYNSIPHEGHPYSSGELYEYDPPKNGQNIIRHGIGFDEVVSYSRKFGTLLVPIPDKIDRERCVIFSDLDLRREEDQLEIMHPSKIRDMNYTISIASLRNGKFRFISARLLSSKKKKYVETIAQALREVVHDERARRDFIDRCVEILEKNLIQPALPDALTSGEVSAQARHDHRNHLQPNP
ncbi:hypothetical protein [Thauera aromatica]|uniref:Uncharacterized protein n=1 Tax=Thauera aromatica K172 TaxID=44139 RepID=A0A2R4BJ27_THAAR|nr:hypothetical protein [Thauera aromatica]AVR87320.1 hypothetical protein Tharo_0370 [Thauera aromatica K172]